MRTLYTYTNNTMCGHEFVIVTDNGNDGWYVTGNTAATAENTSKHDLEVAVKSRKQLKEIAERLDWLGKYSNLGRR